VKITPHSVYLQRRQFLRTALLGVIGSTPLGTAANEREDLTPLSAITSYNNYYEFSVNKKAVKFLAQEFSPEPWHISIEGEVNKPRRISVNDLMTRYPSERRVYRFRCVEGWSMVVPWNGFPLSSLLEDSQPNPDARFVAFESVVRPTEMIGQRNNTMDWPYRESLRLDEAMHPLTLLATGLYDAPLPNQNGAPIRLVVPWKYGYKSIKAVTRIRLTKNRPVSTWTTLAPAEYGFYGNVNPALEHPRWSQKREVRLGETRKRRTQFLNGYAEQVAGLYTEADLLTL